MEYFNNSLLFVQIINTIGNLIARTNYTVKLHLQLIVGHCQEGFIQVKYLIAMSGSTNQVFFHFNTNLMVKKTTRLNA